MATRTLQNLEDEVLVRLGANTTLGYYTDAILYAWISEAHRWAASYKKWPFTEARVSTTYASLVTSEDGYLRGEYPEGFKADSIRSLVVGGKRIQKVAFNKFLSFMEDNPSDDEKIFSDWGRNYYLNPNMGLSGTVMVWGQYMPYIDTTDDTALTVFSDYDEEGNEAIIDEVISYALTREKKASDAQFFHQKAIEHLNGIWARIQDEQFGYHTTDDEGQFKRIDIISGNLREDTLKRDQWY